MFRRVLLSALVALLPLPAAADWIVTVDGTRFETRGPWKVKGRLIIFTRGDGTLVSLRASEVDLAKSEEATRQALEPPPAAVAPVRRPSVASLTEKDLPPVTEPPAPGEGPTSEPVAASPEPTTGLSVLSWRPLRRPEATGFQIFGVLQNGSPQMALRVGVVVVLLDRDGTVVAEAPASLAARSLPPGQAVNFNADFPNQIPYEDVQFRIQGDLMSGPGAPAPQPPPVAETTQPPPVQ